MINGSAHGPIRVQTLEFVVDDCADSILSIIIRILLSNVFEKLGGTCSTCNNQIVIQEKRACERWHFTWPSHASDLDVSLLDLVLLEGRCVVLESVKFPASLFDSDTFDEA